MLVRVWVVVVVGVVCACACVRVCEWQAEEAFRLQLASLSPQPRDLVAYMREQQCVLRVRGDVCRAASWELRTWSCVLLQRGAAVWQGMAGKAWLGGFRLALPLHADRTDATARVGKQWRSQLVAVFGWPGPALARQHRRNCQTPAAAGTPSTTPAWWTPTSRPRVRALRLRDA